MTTKRRPRAAGTNITPQAVELYRRGREIIDSGQQEKRSEELEAIRDELQAIVRRGKLWCFDVLEVGDSPPKGRHTEANLLAVRDEALADRALLQRALDARLAREK